MAEIHYKDNDGKFQKITAKDVSAADINHTHSQYAEKPKGITYPDSSFDLVNVYKMDVNSVERTTTFPVENYIYSGGGDSQAYARNALPTVQAVSNAINGYVDENDSTYQQGLIFEAGTQYTSGKTGVVPAPTKDDTSKFLRGDGTWAAVTSGASGNYLPTAGGTMTGDLTLSQTSRIVLNQRKSSAYNILAEAHVDGQEVAAGERPAHIGFHNTGGTNETGSIVLVPHKIEADP